MVVVTDKGRECHNEIAQWKMNFGACWYVQKARHTPIRSIRACGVDGWVGQERGANSVKCTLH